MIAVTGATGQLGRLVIHSLLKAVPAQQITAVVRDPAKAEAFKAEGAAVRPGDYDDPTGLERAFAGVRKLLLISAGEPGKRVRQHENAITAAKESGVELIAYTSLLHADISTLELAADHRATETLLKASGVPYVLLRNGWYTENYLGALPMALAHGAFVGCAGEARIASASRLDYADAAAAVLTSREDQSGKVYELAGDEPYTLAELAAEVARQTGKPIVYRNMSEAGLGEALIGADLPEPVARMLVGFDIAAAKGDLFDDRRDLSDLIGRPTTPLRAAVSDALAAVALQAPPPVAVKG
jgi:NAD(P)H dehydrogenase (quinone)